ILAGVVGLVLQYRREHHLRETDDQDDRPPPRVYRQTPCQLDRALVDKLSRATQALRIFLKEKQWETDWPTYESHQEQADKLLTANDLTGAFREYCRAMRPLAESLQRHRKEDSGPPLWNGAGDGRD